MSYNEMRLEMNVCSDAGRRRCNEGMDGCDQDEWMEKEEWREKRVKRQKWRRRKKEEKKEKSRQHREKSGGVEKKMKKDTRRRIAKCGSEVTKFPTVGDRK